jgi:hypothetical protein
LDLVRKRYEFGGVWKSFGGCVGVKLGSERWKTTANRHLNRGEILLLLIVGEVVVWGGRGRCEVG